MYTHITIRFGELFLKGNNKKIFIQKLLNNIYFNIKIFNVSIKNKGTHFEIDLSNIENTKDLKKLTTALEKVSGISSFSLAIKTPYDEKIIIEKILNLLDEIKPKSFKIDAKRRYKEIKESSSEIKRSIGIKVQKQTNFLVDLISPKKIIFLDVYMEYVYITCEKIIGIDGLPVGTSGKALMMISGGIDSPVASYLLMKRGIQVEYLHFITPPHTSAESLNKVKKIIKELNGFSNHSQILHIIDFSKIQHEIMCTIKENYRITIMRRFFYRFAAEIAKKNNCKILGTGESLGQVASQTIESLISIQAAINSLVIRPLITFNKDEIIAIAKKIDTYNISIEPFEDCCTLFVPKSPVTKPAPYVAEFEEKKMLSEEIFSWIMENSVETIIIE